MVLLRSGVVVETKETLAQSANFTDLVPAADYTCRVRASTAAGFGPFSIDASGRTSDAGLSTPATQLLHNNLSSTSCTPSSSLQIVPNTPTIAPVVSVFGAFSLVVSWVEIAVSDRNTALDNILYSVFVDGSLAASGLVAPNATLTGLSAATAYSIQYSVQNAEGSSGLSPALSATTWPSGLCV